ncbi:MAG: tRNA lysidine(34) synthetase TilS, partial [Candidatus Omnitrophica bacterium]|nr:tRNA lysidine(34) synthetase TilS [Candidatus Omnitrophota bacterium]
MKTKIINKIREFISKHNLINLNKTYIIAVSGGPDSVCLMDILSKIYKNNKKNFIIAYIHHGLRKEADKEIHFVKKISTGYGFSFYCRKIKINKQKGKSIENEARKKRYQSLKDLAKKKGCDGIITGHTLDDQAETILLNMLRGSGLTGLCGMRPEVKIGRNKSVSIIRPLLFISKKDILEYLEKEKLKFQTDKSNFDLKYRRNYIRYKILPVIEKINTGFKKNIGNLSIILQADSDFIKSKAEYYYKRISENFIDNIVIDFKKFTLLPIALQREIVKKVIKEITKSLYSPP